MLKEIGLWESVATSYRKALELLNDKAELSSAESKQKDNYDKYLKMAEEKMEPVVLEGTILPKEHEGQRPWDRANPIVEPFKTDGSTHVVNNAEISSVSICASYL